MIRVVLDTNIVVSATLHAGGLPEAVFNLAIGGVIQFCISEPVLAEYEEVLCRPRLAIPPEKVAKCACPYPGEKRLYGRHRGS